MGTVVVGVGFEDRQDALDVPERFGVVLRSGGNIFRPRNHDQVSDQDKMTVDPVLVFCGHWSPRLCGVGGGCFHGAEFVCGPGGSAVEPLELSGPRILAANIVAASPTGTGEHIGLHRRGNLRLAAWRFVAVHERSPVKEFVDRKTVVEGGRNVN